MSLAAPATSAVTPAWSFVIADSGLARTNLNWTASRGIDAMCADSWRWQSRNPNGYHEKNTGGTL
ncbi:MAG: hypothetical protein WCJ37_02675 [Syntrophus sp. (in: bacteria)]